MKAVGYDIENPLSSGRSATARLLDNESHRVRLVNQAQAPFLVAVPSVSGIAENTAANKNAESLRDEGGDPADVDILAAGAIGSRKALIDIGANREVPVPSVRCIDRELGCFRRNLHCRSGELEYLVGSVKREDVDTPPKRKNERGLRTVDNETGSKLRTSGLPERRIDVGRRRHD